VYEEPAAPAVHCLAHSFNLVLQDTTKLCRPVKDALDVVHDCVKFFRNSPKCSLLLASHVSNVMFANEDESPEDAPDDPDLGQRTGDNEGKGRQFPSLKPLCPTRWTVRTSSIASVLKNLHVLHSTLDELRCDRHSTHASAAASFDALLDKFSTFFELSCHC
jgi:hypothetical protein